MSSPEPSRPQFTPTARELDDVELLRMGVLDPTDGFAGPEGNVSLSAPSDIAASASECGELEIIDPEGVPMAVVTLESTYPRGDGDVGIIGAIRPLPGTIRRAFGDFYLPPSSSKTRLHRRTLTIPVVSALSSADLAEVAGRIHDLPPLFLVLAGEGSPRGLSRSGLIRATRTAASRFPGSVLIVVPAAAREHPSDEDAFRQRVIAAYAPGTDVYLPQGHGGLPPDIAAVVAADRPSGLDQGLVVFFTGLSGSGKSTISQALRDRVVENGERTVSLLDGDLVRRNLSRGLTFSRADRETNIERIGWVAAEIARHGALVICSPIAPFARTRRKARAMVTGTGAAFVLVHVATPLEVCESRDRKGLYAKARTGEVQDFTGISSPYETPDDADFVVDTSRRTVDSILDEILTHLVAHGWLRSSVLESELARPGAVR